MKALYAKWQSQPGTSEESRQRAMSRGWRDPQWWEDYGHIDDPAFDPDQAERALDRREQAALRRAEIEHLAAFNVHETEIAHRLGMDATYVHDLIRDMKKAA